MSVAGVIGLFRANPQHPVGADGRMALADHLRELRARLLRVVLVLVVALFVALFFYDQLLELILTTRTTTPGRSSAPSDQHHADHQRRRRPAAAAAQAVRPRRARGRPAPTGSTRSGRFIVPGPAPATSGAGPGCSPRSPARCSSPAWRSATTCCPRASRC